MIKTKFKTIDHRLKKPAREPLAEALVFSSNNEYITLHLEGLSEPLQAEKIGETIIEVFSRSFGFVRYPHALIMVEVASTLTDRIVQIAKKESGGCLGLDSLKKHPLFPGRNLLEFQNVRRVNQLT